MHVGVKLILFIKSTVCWDTFCTDHIELFYL